MKIGILAIGTPLALVLVAASMSGPERAPADSRQAVDTVVVDIRLGPGGDPIAVPDPVQISLLSVGRKLQTVAPTSLSLSSHQAKLGFTGLTRIDQDFRAAMVRREFLISTGAPRDLSVPRMMLALRVVPMWLVRPSSS